MQTRFWIVITQFGQLPGLLLWPVLFFVISQSYDLTLLFVFAGLLSYAGGGLIKLIYHKPRPNGLVYTSWFQKIKAGSMPSVHTSNMMVVILGFVYRFGMLGVYENFWHSFAIVTIVLLCGILIMISRIELKRHHAVDVLAGLVFGVIVFVIALLTYDFVREGLHLIRRLF